MTAPAFSESDVETAALEWLRAAGHGLLCYFD
jgi:hypothetical protein